MAKAITAALVVAFVTVASAQSRPQPAPHTPSTPASGRVNPDAAAQADFQARLERYLALRQDLASRLKPLAPTANAAELAARQESLAAAVRDVRKDARPGDLIPPAVAAQITRIVRDDFRRRNPSAARAVLEEVPDSVTPAINKTLPDNAALATMPALLLNNLPRLPDNLQYRFVRRHIILLDGDTRLIMDYIANVLPAH